MISNRLIAGVAAAALASPLTRHVADVLAHQPSLCPLQMATGVACPSCGGTRAVLYLAGGDPMAARAMNPGVTAFAVALGVLWVTGRLGPLKEGVAKSLGLVADFSR